jgi:hypothetical protein
LKTTRNHAKLPQTQEHPKKLTKYLVFNTPKWLFLSGPSQLSHPKKKKNNTKSRRIFFTRIFGALKTGLKPKNVAVFPKINNQRRPKILQKSSKISKLSQENRQIVATQFPQSQTTFTFSRVVISFY